MLVEQIFGRKSTKFHAKIILCSKDMKVLVKSFENATERHQKLMKLLAKEVLLTLFTAV